MFQDQEFSLDHISCMGAAISESISVHNGDALKNDEGYFWRN